MRTLVRRLNADPKYAKLFELGKLGFVTGFAQALIQAISLVSGIVVIRLLSTQEYALYTIANTMLGTMVLLSDSGITSGVMAHGGQVWQDRDKLGSVLVTGLSLRKKFAIASLLVAVPILVYFLRVHDASWLMCILISGALIPAFFAALSDSLFEISLKLRQDVTALQKNQLSVSLIRGVMLCAGIFFFPFTYIAVLANGLPRIWGNIKLRKISNKYANPEGKFDPVIKKDMLNMVRLRLPDVIYYCLSSQIAIWLISTFGTTSSLAEIGALSRLNAVLTLFTVMFNTLIQPRFARLPKDKSLIFGRFLKIYAGLIALSIVIVAVTWIFATQIIWILGKQYSSLEMELVLSMIAACVGTLISGGAFILYSSRGWVINPIISIGTNIGAFILGALVIDLSTLTGILYYNIYIASVQLIMNTVYVLYKINKLKDE